MLILTRRPNEVVVIIPDNGPEIRIQVLGVKGNQVRLGFEAPAGVMIDREEVHDRKKLEGDRGRPEKS